MGRWVTQKGHFTLREAYRYQNGWIFGKVPNGGGGHFQSKNFCCKFWTFEQGFFGIKMIQRGIFRVCFFNNLKRNLKKKFSWDTLGKHHYKNISVHLGIARLGGGHIWLLSKSLNVLKVLGPINPRIWSWDIVFDSRDHYFWYSRTQGFSKIYHMYGF